MPVKPIPDGYHTATPYLVIRGAKRALEFYKKALGAEELMRIPGREPDQIGHAEIQIGNSRLMLADEVPEMGIRSPDTLGGTPVSIMLYVEDSDARFQQALTAGATEVQPLKDQFYGDRSGSVKDPFGHMWTIATHKEDLTPEQLQQRLASHEQEFEKQQKSKKK